MIDRKGFTLIELLIIMSVFIVLLLILVPSTKSYMSYNNYMAFRTSVYQLLSDIRMAQELSVGEKIPYTICFIPSSEVYYITKPDNPSPKVILYRNFPKKVDLVSTNFIDNRFYYSETGAPSMGGTITLKFNNKLYEITVIPVTGRVKLKTPF